MKEAKNLAGTWLIGHFAVGRATYVWTNESEADELRSFKDRSGECWCELAIRTRPTNIMSLKTLRRRKARET